jgi:hypothetical protein
MFRDESITTTTTEWAWEERRGSDGDERNRERHREIDQALRGIAAQRCGLDVEEARWLRAAEAEGAWKKLGYVHGLEYLEDVFGYRPRTAKERLRVARELGEMPELEDALGDGELNYSVVRELTRVATPATVDRWIERARGKNLRDVEQMVSGRRKGDDPDDAPDPEIIDHSVRLDLDAEHHALWRDLRKGLEEELGRSLTDKEVIAELHARAFSSTTTNAADSNAADANTEDSNAEKTNAEKTNAEKTNAEKTNAEETTAAVNHGEATSHAPRRMIHISTCPDCRRAWQDGAGVPMQISTAALERAQCDAIVCNNDPETRARQTIAERIRRKVMERDRWRCTFPGCRSARHLEVHHVDHVADGGDNEPTNLTTLCGGHHGLHHDGGIGISGQAPDALLFSRDGRVLARAPQGARAEHRELAPADPVAANTEPRFSPTRSKFEQVETRTLAKAALQQAGYRAAIAKRAVDVALAHVGTDVDLTGLIKEALRHCG